jgi:hypothetical protein
VQQDLIQTTRRLGFFENQCRLRSLTHEHTMAVAYEIADKSGELAGSSWQAWGRLPMRC